MIEQTKPAERPTPWTQAQVQMAATIWQIDYADYHGDDDCKELQDKRCAVMQRIAGNTGRNYLSVYWRFRAFGPSFGTNISRSRDASATALSDLAARKEAIARQSEVSRMLGEPPPGYSALDRKRSGVAR